MSSPHTSRQPQNDPDRSASWPPAATSEHLTLERSATWPSTASAVEDKSNPTSAMPPTAPIRIGKASDDSSYFEEELNKAPEDHFLSPIQMHEYEDWDSDDDGEEVEWDAGITDFALFNNDRQRAQERHEKVPDRWNQLLASQASAFQRAAQRSRADSDPSLEEIPQLTPDNSPSLRDEFDMDAHFATFGHKPQAPRPNFLSFRPTRTTTFDVDDDDSDFDSEDEEDADLPLSLIIQRAKERQRAARMFERPGLRFSRTLSGKQHVWRRPSHEIYPLNEDVAGEKKAEHDYYRGEASVDDEQRGRR